MDDDKYDGDSIKAVQLALDELTIALKDLGLWSVEYTTYGLIAAAIQNLYGIQSGNCPEFNVDRSFKMTPERAQQIHIRHLRSLSAKSYNKTAHWQSLRNEALELAGHKCFKCAISSRNQKLHVHHLSYKHIGYESQNELRVLCPKCHRREHQIYPQLVRPSPEELS
jgi:hypothetical protein